MNPFLYDQFVTTKIVKGFYNFLVVLLGVAFVGGIIAAIAGGNAYAYIMIVGAPLSVIVLRITAELVLVQFSILDELKKKNNS